MENNRPPILTITIAIIVVGIILFAVYVVATMHVKVQSPTPTGVTSPSASIERTASSSAAVLGIQTKANDCQAYDARPDATCTPGAVFPNATKDQICTPGYAKSVRDVPSLEKNQAYAEYSIGSHPTGSYEVDHLVSLELGGSNDIANLWPEAANPKPGFHEKDMVENYLHDQVCHGTINLSDAQQKIATNWLSVYQQAGLSQ